MKRLINFIIFYLAVGSVSKFIQLTKRMRNKAKSSFIRNLVLTCFYPIESVLWGLLLVYITYFIARIVFFVGKWLYLTSLSCLREVCCLTLLLFYIQMQFGLSYYYCHYTIKRLSRCII